MKKYLNILISIILLLVPTNCLAWEAECSITNPNTISSLPTPSYSITFTVELLGLGVVLDEYIGNDYIHRYNYVFKRENKDNLYTCYYSGDSNWGTQNATEFCMTPTKNGKFIVEKDIEADNIKHIGLCSITKQ